MSFLVPTTLYDGSEAQVARRANAMHHKNKVVHLFWLTWEHTMMMSALVFGVDYRKPNVFHIPTHTPSGISTEMFSTPLLTVRGRVCSEGEVIHSSCNPIG